MTDDTVNFIRSRMMDAQTGRAFLEHYIRAGLELDIELSRENAALRSLLAEWAADGYYDTGGDDSPDAGIIICAVCSGESKGRFMDFVPSDHADKCLLARTERLLAVEAKAHE
jgi:hypothetical protein